MGRSPPLPHHPQRRRQRGTAGAQYAGRSGLINIKRDDALLHLSTGHYLRHHPAPALGIADRTGAQDGGDPVLASAGKAGGSAYRHPCWERVVRQPGDAIEQDLRARLGEDWRLTASEGVQGPGGIPLPARSREALISFRTHRDARSGGEMRHRMQTVTLHAPPLSGLWKKARPAGRLTSVLMTCRTSTQFGLKLGLT